ncbi:MULTISPECIES: hypothetical protein [Streptomyces]|uniref:hypothetical protein n=1 Tax=Streptomyces TaxID=1883 RepID=UPI00216318BD|nr:hypothetical protein [Streptomyces sp. M7]
MTDIGDMDLEDLVSSWEEIRDEYDYWAPDGEHDETVLGCAARLAAAPGAADAYVWVLGLTLLAPYTNRSGVGSRAEAEAALRAADAAQRAASCDHDTHPYETHTSYGDDEELPDLLLRIPDETAEWYEDHSRAAWRCPRNVAGFARIALDILRPGEVEDVPPRLSLEDREDIRTLQALLELYPEPGTDVAEEIASQGSRLHDAEPAERPGRLHVVRAVSWHAVSGMIQDRSVLRGLIGAVEKVLPDFADATCDHGGHPKLSGHSTDAAELGIVLSSPSGRRVYEHKRDHYGGGAPLDQMVCPAFMAEVARETLTGLRAGYDKIFGPRDTSHLDAEYLRPDGRLDIEKITERLHNVSWNERHADALGLWAARRYDRLERLEEDGGQIDRLRERTVLLLTARQAMTISYPAPPYAVARDVLAALRRTAAAPRPERCAHTDAHPPLDAGEFRTGLPHFYAPEEFPPTDDGHGVESWTCARFAGQVADACVAALEGLYEEDGAQDEAEQ